MNSKSSIVSVEVINKPGYKPYLVILHCNFWQQECITLELVSTLMANSKLCPCSSEELGNIQGHGFIVVKQSEGEKDVSQSISLE